MGKTSERAWAIGFPFGEVVAARPPRSRRAWRRSQTASGSTRAGPCDELWEKRGKRRSHEARRVIGFLRNEPALRTRFLDPIAGSAMNKIFECGMIP